MKTKGGNNVQKTTNDKHIPINLLLSEGNKYLRVLQFEKAISKYDMILQKNANHVKSLLGKGKCYMELGRYSEALSNFEKILSINPKCTEAINLKGTTEYLIGDFEKSYITYRQGHQIQPFHHNLRVGYSLCKKAIENSLYSEERMILTGRDVVKLKNSLLKTDADATTSYDKKGVYSDDLQLLDDMCKDKNLTALHSACAELFNYLKGRQQFRKIQESHKTIDKTSSSIFINNNMYNLVQMNKLVRNFGFCGLALDEKRTKFCIQKGNEVLNLLNSEMREDFSGKNAVETETLHFLVMAYLTEEDFETATKYCTQLHNIANDRNLQTAKRTALSDFGEIYYKSKDYKDSLNYFEKSLHFTDSEEEKASILYKISDCNVHLSRLKDAKETAKKCLDLVVRLQNLRFQFDVLLLLAEIAVKEREMELAKECFRSALEIAVQNNDKRKVDLEHLLEIFEEIDAKESYSKERINIIKITDKMKYS